MNSDRHSLLDFFIYWFRLERIVCILLILFIAGLIISFIGFPKNINEALEGCILTESGEQIPCTVTLEGEVTSYPFRKGKYSMTDQLRVAVDGKFLANACYDRGNTYYVHSDSRTVELILWTNREMLLAEFDIQQFFPEMESCRAILAVPAQNLNQVAELLRDPNLTEDHLKPFLWILK